MPTPRDLQELVGYNRAVLESFLDRLERRSWRFATRDREIGHHSILQTVVHLIGVQDGWLNFVLDRRYRDLDAAVRARPAFTSWSSVRAWERDVFDAIEARVARITPREIAAPARAPWKPGRYTVGDAYLQATFEEAHHLGEIIGAMWQVEMEPPEMTWIDTRRRIRNRPRRGRRSA